MPKLTERVRPRLTEAKLLRVAFAAEKEAHSETAKRLDDLMKVVLVVVRADATRLNGTAQEKYMQAKTVDEVRDLIKERSAAIEAMRQVACEIEHQRITAMEEATGGN